MNEIFRKNYAGKLQAVIFDWAGTTVDYGCFAPTGVFIDVFRQKGIEITIAEARGPMGMHKRDHIRVISQYPRVATEWKIKYGHFCSEDEIEEMFNNFIPLQLAVIEKHSEIVPELPAALEVIRSLGMKIGSTTGYNNEMMEILTVAAARQGYVADSVVCATDVPAGRPAPWMALKNAENLGIYPMQAFVKIGDTIADIEEGINAGMWSVGVIHSSNEMGLTQDEINLLDKTELEKRSKKVREDYLNAGADYVIESLAELKELIEKINARLAVGERP
ncbi:MAG: phosphonoacetaldehyde hydrolase [Lentimicrobiaceae bacterium]|jgi:phosphonoacetaldehyde hydrolase